MTEARGRDGAYRDHEEDRPAEADPAARKMQQVQFAKNLATLGGLVYALRDARD